MKIRTLITPALLAAGLSLGMAPAVQAHDLDRLYGKGETCNIASHYDNDRYYGDRRHRWHDGKQNWYRGDGHRGNKQGHQHKDGRRYSDKYSYRDGRHRKDGRHKGYYERDGRAHRKDRHVDYRDDGRNKGHRKDRHGEFRTDGHKHSKRHHDGDVKRRNRS